MVAMSSCGTGVSAGSLAEDGELAPRRCGALRDSRNLPSPDGVYHKATEDCAVS